MPRAQPCPSLATAKRKNGPEHLNGWQKIARFLGRPISVAERWGKSGMLPRSSLLNSSEHASAARGLPCDIDWDSHDAYDDRAGDSP